ncbi:MAG: serine hydrolase [Bacteroidota bacterium]
MRNFAITLLFSAAAIASCAQPSARQASDFVPDNGITSPMHGANVGHIRFLDNTRPLSENQESDFLATFEVLPSSDLNFSAFLDRSLANHLHELDPSLSPEQLVEKGNYQFSFYVDEALIYTENLHPAANTPTQKMEETVLRRPFISSTDADSWGRFLWNRFYYRRGGKAALKKGIHTLKVEIRPYLKTDQLMVGDLLAAGEIRLQWGEPAPVPEEQKAIQAIQPNSGWEVSGAGYDTEKIRALNEKIAQSVFKNIASIVVIKEGELLLEEYFNGANRNTLHDTRSVGKSFASTVAGIALEEGHLQSTQQTLDEFYELSAFSNSSPEKGEVTLQNLLTMSAGFLGNDDDYDSPGNEEYMYPTDNWVKFGLDLPMDEAVTRGQNWQYFTAGVVILGDILHQTVPGGLEKYADEKLFRPMGITNYQWPHTPQGVASTAGGLQLTALDFAKYGQLYKNGGTWNGQQILTSDWVQESFTNYFAGAETPGYGYLFWNHQYTVGDETYEVFQCSGNGGNKVIVFEEQDMVIVVTATAYGQSYAHPQVYQMLEEYILPAVLD